MLALSRHIDLLLLEHDCVIIPEFGGFIAQYVPAHYIADEGLLVPPYRSIGFNSHLTFNDGLLVQSYMQTYGVDYTQAMAMIAEASAMLRRRLAAGESIRIGGGGMLRFDRYGAYAFESAPHGVAAPALYGLEPFALRMAKPAQQPLSLAQKRGFELRLVRGSKELINYAAAIVIAFAFYFAWSTPIDTPTTGKTMQAALPIAMKLQTEVKHDVPAAKPDAPTEKVLTHQSHTNEDVATATTENVYTLVLASCIPLKNAQAYVEQLKKEGAQHASVYANRKMVRVVYGAYHSEADAHLALHQLRAQHKKHFGAAWVLQLAGDGRGVQ